MKKLLYSLASFSSFGMFFSSFLIGSSNPHFDYFSPKMPQSYLGPSTPFEAEYAPPAEQGGFAQQGHPQSWRNFGPQLRNAEPLVYREPPKQNQPRQLIGLLPDHFSINDIDDSDNDLLTLLAKINESGKFDGKVDLRSVKFKDGKKALKTISQKIPVILLRVNPNGSFKPFFFIDLSILSPNGNNTCKPGNLSDGNIRDALSNSTLGQGKGWKNTRILNDWRELIEQGKALFFVEFNNQLFALVPRTDENENIAGITSKNWNTSLGKKILMGAGAVAATGAAAYGIYYLINSNNPKPGPGPQPEPVVPQTDAAPPTKSPEPSDVHQTTQNAIADSAQQSVSETQPINQQANGFIPQNVHQATLDAIISPVQRSIFHDPRRNKDMLDFQIHQNATTSSRVEYPHTRTAQSVARTIETITISHKECTVWGVTCMAKIISEVIANCVCSGDIKTFPDWFNRILKPDEKWNRNARRFFDPFYRILSPNKKPELNPNEKLEHRLKKHYMQATHDPIVGPLVGLTWSAYEALHACVTGKASIGDVVSKVKKAKDAILNFFNSPNGALGMNRAMNFLRSNNHHDLDELKHPPYDSSIPKLNFMDNPIDIQGMCAVSCLIGLRSMETALPYLESNGK